MTDSYICQGITRSGSRCKRRCDNKGFCSHHPAQGGKVTKTGFSMLQGVHKSMVSKWISEGTIEADEQGHIEWEAAERSIKAARSPAHALQRQGDPHEESIFADAVDDDLDADEVRRRYAIAQMKEREEKARREEIARLEDEGRLVDIDDVRGDAADAAEKLKAKLLALPDHLSPRLASISDIRKIHKEITAAITKALTELSTEFIDQ